VSGLPKGGKAPAAVLTSSSAPPDPKGAKPLPMDQLRRVCLALGFPERDLDLAMFQCGCRAPGSSVAYPKLMNWICGAQDPQDEESDTEINFIPHPPAVPEEEYSLEQLKEWQDKYTKVDSIIEALETGDTVLIKGTWLLEMSYLDEPLPKRQDLPAEAIWVVEGARDDLPEGRYDAASLRANVAVAALSYCWASPGHPDPTGEQLQRLARVVEVFLGFVNEVAIFIDWCSLYQQPRTDEQQESFCRALKHVNLWYAHQLVHSWMLTTVPEGGKPYMERGWPTFEYAISGLLKNANMFIDLAYAPEDPGPLVNFENLQNDFLMPCRAVRAAPCTPLTFRKKLDSLAFTNGSDRPFVMKRYLSTFREVMASAKHFDMTQLSWSAEQGQELAAALHWCKALQTIGITDSAVNIEGVEAIAAALTQCRNLHTLDLDGCHFGDQGAKAFIRALNETSLKKLFLSRNDISDEGVALLAEKLEARGARVREVSLRGNRVSDAGAERLAEALRKQGCPLELLRVSDNSKVGDAGAEALASAAEECPGLRLLDCRRTAVSPHGKACLDAAESRNPRLQVMY